ncbi:MAG: hypothetical protein AAF570_25480, partial [Bacteroidota bacterium]
TTDGSPVVLHSGDLNLPNVPPHWLLEEDFQLRILALRDGLSIFLTTQPMIYVEPNYQVPFALEVDPENVRPEDTFDRDVGTVLILREAQASVRYTLYARPGDWAEFGEEVAVYTVEGQSGTLELATGGLPADRYRFEVEAVKDQPERRGRVQANVLLEVSIRRDVDVEVGLTAIPYLGTAEVTFLQCQPFVEYQMFEKGGDAVSTALLHHSGTNMLVSNPLREDTEVILFAYHRLTTTTEQLDAEFDMDVGPRTDIAIAIAPNNAEYGTSPTVSFSEGQASVTYELRPETVHPLYFPEAPPELDHSPHLDGGFSIPFGPIHFAQRLSIVARKTENGMTATLLENFLLQPFPNAAVSVTYPTEPLDYGASAIIFVGATPEMAEAGKVMTEFQTRYLLRHENGHSISQAFLSNSPGLIALNTPHLYDDIVLGV